MTRLPNGDLAKGVLLGAAIVIAMGSRPADPEVLQARRIELHDDAGRMRIVLDAGTKDGGPQIAMLAMNGDPLLTLTGASSGGYAFFFDDEAHERLLLGVNGSDVAIGAKAGPDGRDRLWFHANDEETSLALFTGGGDVPAEILVKDHAKTEQGAKITPVQIKMELGADVEMRRVFEVTPGR